MHNSTRCNIGSRLPGHTCKNVASFEHLSVKKDQRRTQAQWVGSTYACSSIPRGRSSISRCSRASEHTQIARKRRRCNIQVSLTGFLDSRTCPRSQFSVFGRISYLFIGLFGRISYLFVWPVFGRIFIFICSLTRPDHRESKRSATFLRTSTTEGYSHLNLPTEKRTGGLGASARKPSIPWTFGVRVASEKADGRSRGTSARKPSISWSLRFRYARRLITKPHFSY